MENVRAASEHTSNVGKWLFTVVVSHTQRWSSASKFATAKLHAKIYDSVSRTSFQYDVCQFEEAAWNDPLLLLHFLHVGEHVRAALRGSFRYSTHVPGRSFPTWRSSDDNREHEFSFFSSFFKSSCLCFSREYFRIKMDEMAAYFEDIPANRFVNEFLCSSFRSGNEMRG